MVIPEAYQGREQTYVKHYFLRTYLERVLFVTLSPQSRFNEFVYVDGFSGPWKSQDEGYRDTSFAIAIERLAAVRAKCKAMNRLVKVRCVFVEESGKVHELQAAVNRITDMEIKVYHGKFEAKIAEILEWIGPSPSTFVLTFVDPKGWSVDLAAIAPLLARRPGEVIYNFMYSFLHRFPDHPDEKVRLSYELPLGKDWRNKLDSSIPFDEGVLKLFTENLKAAGGFVDVLKVTVQKPTVDMPHFYLFYGTRHRKGVIEFRSAQRNTSAEEARVRHEAKAMKRELRDKQPDFLVAAGLEQPVDDELRHEQELNAARVALIDFLINYGKVRFERLVDYLLVQHEITQKDVQLLLVSELQGGRIKIHGMGPRERTPKDGHLIEIKART
jgi:three-Cys-motif partner protein